MSSHTPWLKALGLTAIAILSFFLYATYFFKGFNSDHAIQVLMAEDFRFSSDLYYWGQDRLGSIIPLLAYPLVKLGFKAIWALSIAQYLLLVGSFLLLQGFFKKYRYKLLLAIVVFLPHAYFQVQVTSGHPYVGQLFFMALLIFTFKSDKINERLRWQSLPLVAAAMLWSSEMGLATLAALGLIYPGRIFRSLRQWPNLLALILSSLAGYYFLSYAKAHAHSDIRYGHLLATPDQILEALVRLAREAWEALSFTTPYWFHSLLLYAILLSLILIISYRPRPRRLSLFFAVSALLSIGLVLLSNWAALMDFPIRYYTPAYFQFMLALLFMGQQLLKTAFQLSVAVVVILTATSGLMFLYQFNYEVNERLNRSEIREIAAMGDFGLVGSYWNTYAVDAFSEDIKATPFYGSYIRHWPVVEEVFQKDSIMIIRNGFLPALPDTLSQFERQLERISAVQHLNEFEYAYYQKIQP